MYQKVVVVGNLGGDPEMRYMPDGTAVTNFSVATNRRWNDRQTGQPVDETTWFRVSVWGRQAEVANQYLSKGRMVLVEGRLQPDPATGGPRIWTGQDGIPRASFELRAESVRFVGGRDDAGSFGADDSGFSDEGQQYQSARGRSRGRGGFDDGAPVEEEDDIPF